ncbi:DEAD-box ATP-dependent RNA helicase 7 [Tanacetum coccineum]
MSFAYGVLRRFLPEDKVESIQGLGLTADQRGVVFDVVAVDVDIFLAGQENATGVPTWKLSLIHSTKPAPCITAIRYIGVQLWQKVISMSRGYKLSSQDMGFVWENGYDDNSINATGKYMNKDGRRKIHSGLDSSGIGSTHRESRRD